MFKLLVVVVLLAVVTYALVRVIDRRGVAPVTRKPVPPRPPQRPVGPDDDEDFLRDLEKRSREPRDPDWPS